MEEWETKGALDKRSEELARQALATALVHFAEDGHLNLLAVSKNHNLRSRFSLRRLGRPAAYITNSTVFFPLGKPILIFFLERRARKFPFVGVNLTKF